MDINRETKMRQAIELNGKENYEFLIVSLHKTKGSLHYREVEMQIFEDVLRKRLDTGQRKYYNGNISAVKFYPPELQADEIEMTAK